LPVVRVTEVSDRLGPRRTPRWLSSASQVGRAADVCPTATSGRDVGPPSWPVLAPFDGSLDGYGRREPRIHAI
jgi:hypothetical protein